MHVVTHRLLVTGREACFRRPEFRHDRISHDVTTPAPARSLFEAVYWTPAIWWIIDRIEVLCPIRTRWQPTDDYGSRPASKTRVLADVGYVIAARFECDGTGKPNDTGRHAAMFKRRARSQRFFKPPTLGGLAWPATIRLVEQEETFLSAYADQPNIDLGWMVFDRDRADRDRLRYFRPIMDRGVIDLTAIDPAALPS